MESLEHPFSPHLSRAEGIELSTLFCGDERMRDLNQKYRGKPTPTDVLSFCALEGAGRASALGDLVISLPTAYRQAKRYRHSLNAELLRLSVHGVLHLLGHDHEKVAPNIAARMRRFERRIYSQLRDEAEKLAPLAWEVSPTERQGLRSRRGGALKRPRRS